MDDVLPLLDNFSISAPFDFWDRPELRVTTQIPLGLAGRLPSYLTGYGMPSDEGQTSGNP